jgi:hypothetical protein
MMKNPLNLCFTGEGLNELKLIQKILRVAEWMCEFENWEKQLNDLILNNRFKTMLREDKPVLIQ